MLQDAIPNVEFYDERFKEEFSSPDTENYEYIRRVLLNLALNHAVQADSAAGMYTKPASHTIEEEPSSPLLNASPNLDTQPGDRIEIEYNASSPDELALVNGARYLGVTYIGRDATKNNILNVDFKG